MSLIFFFFFLKKKEAGGAKIIWMLSGRDSSLGGKRRFKFMHIPARPPTSWEAPFLYGHRRRKRIACAASHRHTQSRQPEWWKRLSLGYNDEVDILDGVATSALASQSSILSSRCLAWRMWRPMISRQAEVKGVNGNHILEMSGTWASRVERKRWSA